VSDQSERISPHNIRPHVVHDSEEQTKKRSEGCLLLSLEQNRILSLNESAGVIWAELEQNSQGISFQQLAEAVSRHYSASLSGTKLMNDVEILSERLAKAGFVAVRAVGSEKILKIRSGVFRSADKEVAMPDSSVVCDLQFQGQFGRSRKRMLVDITLAFIALLSFEIVKLLLGFGRLIAIVKNFPSAATTKHVALRTRQICESVNRAKLWYPKQIHCLQHSAVVTCLLRVHGIPATMIIGASQRPFYAHAWSEVCGNVVNDSQSVREKYAPFMRAWK
jgi:hypothetical protein